MHNYTKEDHLIYWSTSNEARGILPDLIRRLIIKFINKDEFIEPPDFPANCVINRKGFDGKLKTKGTNYFSQTQFSVWELSTSKNIEGKANKDIIKRNKIVDGIESKRITYIALTSNRWDGKDNWRETRKKENIWADVRAFDCSNIAFWISSYSEVEFWFFTEVLRLPAPISHWVDSRSRKSESATDIQSQDDFCGYEDIFLENIKHLDLILTATKLTKQQIQFVFELIDYNNYSYYFYKKVENPIWLNILYNRGHFHYEKNPDLAKVENGYQIPFWPVLQFLEKTTVRIVSTQNWELLDIIYKIINDISAHPKDNYHTWYHFIKILCNIPNDKIPLSIFDHIQTWFDSKFNTDLQSSVICESLLPKLINPTSTQNDFQKAEKMLMAAFSVKKKSAESARNSFSDIGQSYQPYISLYWLTDVLINKKLIDNVSAHCSENLIYQLCDSIKAILTDFPSGKEFKISINETEYTLKIYYIDNDLNLALESGVGSSFSTRLIKNYTTLTDEEILVRITAYINKNTSFEPPNDVIFPVIDIIFNDFANFWIYSIHLLNKDYRDGDGLFKTYSLILIELLDLRMKVLPEETTILINELVAGNRYNLIFFKRIALYIISKNWNRTTKSIFWKMIERNDQSGYFSDDHYSQEIYYLLNENISRFNKRERTRIMKIIDKGPQKYIGDYLKEYTRYWKLKWFSALRNDSDYGSEYESLSKELKIDYKEFEQSGMVFTEWGTVSPYTIEEISKMESVEIVQRIRSFRQRNDFEKPSIEGFAESIKNAVQDNPVKFSGLINDFIGIPYIYIYNIVQGFKEAWRKKQNFDWNAVLEFCFKYMQDKRFGTDELKVNGDIWEADAHWVMGAIADLISEGTRSDENAYDLGLLLISKKILFNLTKYLDTKTNYEKKDMDFMTYSLNSTAGKVVHALLDFSLRNARNNYNKDDDVKWEVDVKKIFDDLRNRKIIDLFILQGWYYKQFYYLDKYWVEQFTREYYDLESDLWFAFICGYGYENPMYRKEIFELMLPHFRRFLDEKRDNKGILRHFAVYFIWDYTSLDSGSIFTRYLVNCESENIQELIYFLGKQVGYYRNLTDAEKKTRFYMKIISLWEFLLQDKFKKELDANDKFITLLHLTLYFDVLDEISTELIIKSISGFNKAFDAHVFLKELFRFTVCKETIKAAENIGKIFKVMLSEKAYPLFGDQKVIKDLVLFLYENQQKEIADYICNDYAENGNDFLKEIWDRYN